jgi:hypothetical protein
MTISFQLAVDPRPVGRRCPDQAIAEKHLNQQMVVVVAFTSDGPTNDLVIFWIFYTPTDHRTPRIDIRASSVL